MGLVKLEYGKFQELIDKGAILLKNEERNKKRSLEFAILYWLGFSMVLLPTMLSVYLFVEDVISGVFIEAFKAFIFLVFFVAMEALLFVAGLGYYSYSKNPSYVFWKYFIRGKVNLVLAGLRDIDGREYVMSEFMSKSLNYAQPEFLISVNIPKNLYDKAMDLLRKIDNMTFDKDGKKKAVDVEKIVKGVDEDILLLARLLRILIYLYREDISKMGEVYQSVKRQRTYK